ncbi:MFS transporter [Metabacillus malikii]|uniref:Fucose permease n=1 Tax=Metabacillus malikii TaxID=1504265 RepID=A0ABT9ZAK7_9BACI|nr:MFS transporter [Metabacillus malikii]MDQ0229050.1 fucose permease [Metabacillus malikii]
MATLLLLIIYLAFISLGLPDSLLGVAWPVMQSDFDAPLETAGLLFMTIAGGTIISSLLSGRVLKRFGTAKVTVVSTLITACALLGFYFAPSLIWLFLCAIPLGLGAGAIDAGLNDYVAIHYKAHHMSWLHSFWGVGATFGPVVMAQFISGGNAWGNGYLAIAGLQFTLVLILLLSLPLWKRVTAKSNQNTNEVAADSKASDMELEGNQLKPLQIKGVKWSLAAFLFYCGVEATVGLWGSSYLVNIKDISVPVAAQWVSFYFAGITVGRFITGFITFKVSNRTLIRTGQIIALSGAVCLLLPLPALFSLIGLILVGLGLAPIFPCMLHETPIRFGKKHSQTIMGYQMAIAYTGSTFLPPLLGFVASNTTIGIFAFYILLFVAAMLVSSERLNLILVKKGIAAK